MKEMPWEDSIADFFDDCIEEKTKQYLQDFKIDAEDLQDFFKITFPADKPKGTYFESIPNRRWRKFLLSVYYADLVSYTKKEDQADFFRLCYIVNRFPEGFTVWWIRSRDKTYPVGYTGWYYVEKTTFDRIAQLQYTKDRFFMPARTKTPYIYVFNYSITPCLNHSEYSRTLIQDYVSSIAQIQYDGLFCAAVSDDGVRVAERFGMKAIGTIKTPEGTDCERIFLKKSF